MTAPTTTSGRLANLELAPRKDDGIPILNQSGFVPFLIPWQIRPPNNSVVLVVKATFDIVQDQEAALSQEQQMPTGDVHFDEDENASIRYPSDFAILKPKADVFLVGHAYPLPQPGLGLATLSVGNLTRMIAVFGDRSWGTLGAQSKPLPFTQIPLRWERALGGPLSEANPLGRGYKTGVLLPNLERRESLISSSRDAPAPACFAPIPPEWKVRKSKLGTYGSRWLKQSWPYFPDDFDWSYFNSAPPELQVPYLRGDEDFCLSGVHPKIPTIKGRLSGLVPRAFAQHTAAAGGGFPEIPMQLDTLWFDADAMKLVQVWRGLINLRDDEGSEIAMLFVASNKKSEPWSIEKVHAAFEADGVASGLVTRKVSVKPAETPDPSLPPPLPETPAPPPTRAEVLALIASRESLAGRDLTGIDLSMQDLKGVDLSKAVLARANLRGAKLQGAKLVSANLAGVQGQGASFVEADLSGADLHNAQISDANLTKAVLEKTNLSGVHAPQAVFNEVKATGAILKQATLTRAQFAGAALQKADFTQATIDEAVFKGAQLEKARFYEAKGEKVRFDSAVMTNVRMDDAILRSASLVQVKAEDSLWERADLTLAVFQEAQVSKALFTRARLEGAVLNKATAKGACFRKANLKNARLLKANLMQSTLEGADLTGADLRGANLYQVETWRAKLTGAQLQLAIVSGSKLSPTG